MINASPHVFESVIDTVGKTDDLATVFDLAKLGTLMSINKHHVA